MRNAKPAVAYFYLALGGSGVVGQPDSIRLGYRTEKNPRGWVFATDLDVHDPDYVVRFRERVDKYVRDGIEYSDKTCNAQGCMFKDIAGQEFDLGRSFDGMAGEVLPPEMSHELIRGWSEELAKRKMWMGFLLRDDSLIAGPYNTCYRQWSPDPIAWVARKFLLARIRYGDNVLAMDYDSNVQYGAWAGEWRKPPSLMEMQRLQRLCDPRTTFIVEFYAQGYEQLNNVYPRLFDKPFKPNPKRIFSLGKPKDASEWGELRRDIDQGALIEVSAVKWTTGGANEWILPLLKENK